MKKSKSSFIRILLLTALSVLALAPVGTARAAEPGKQIPDPLKTWQDWATWDDKDRDSPTPYQNASRHLSFWPSRMSLDVDRNTGHFDVNLSIFNETWITLPGSREVWPFEVQSNGAPIPVLEHNGNPSVRLPAGAYHLTGTYHWDDMPQRIALPREIGILALTLEGKRVDAPAWDAEGFLWLKRTRFETADKDFLAVKVYRVIEDGIPMWLRTEVELSVSGKSREEALGSILPEGWQLAKVDSPIPVAVDEQGRMKVQVRAGKWLVHAHAFRLTHAAEFRYAPGAAPAVAEELVGFRAQPDFRMVEVKGVPSIDVSQTTFPDQWRSLPVYRWETNSSFQLEERMRGMGLQKPEGLHIARELWLDENGHGLIFRDRITGNMQQIWRLDAAENQDLGSVRSNGEGQLITRNPQNRAPGIEIRARNLNLEATGRMDRAKGLSATGWRSDTDSLSTTLNLPPGWRLFALFGADWVRGDWLTAWSLLDLFLLLIFSLAVYRLWGIGAGLLAFFAFALAYHEPDAPRYVWLVLLIPIALLRVVPPGWGRRCIMVWKYIAVSTLVFLLVPFVAVQVQQAIYPQLENASGGEELQASTGMANVVDSAPAAAPPVASEPTHAQDELMNEGSKRASFGLMSEAARKGYAPQQLAQNSNMAYDAKARIQTGPGVPEWRWNAVQFGWNGPVSATQHVYPVLISLPLQRLLTVLRLALLLSLAAVLLDARRVRLPFFRIPGAAVLALALLGIGLGATTSAQAQLPDREMLQTLRNRLLEAPDAYPNAADIPSVSISLRDRKITMDTEIHTAIRVAVPLPGRLPAWSPVSVLIDGKTEAVLRRDDGYLWAVLPAGVHHVHAEGMLSDATEWEWTFQLKPRRVSIDAPGWTYTGVRPDGIPEQQVFFAMKQKSTTGEAGYDHQDYHTIAALERHLELGLVWQVHNTVNRLSPEGKAVSLLVPLLPGEKVISSNMMVKNGFIEIRLGAHEGSFGWESELPVTNHLNLATKADDAWIEHWFLVASPVWNVTLSGLAPVFQANNADLVPVWHPWPGEHVELAISRPEAVSGATVTIHRVQHDIALGDRQRSSTLNLNLESSLGEDFAIALPEDADITALTHNNMSIPVRKDGGKLIIPLRPGAQTILVQWKTNTALNLHAAADSIVLPVESANITTALHVPENRWVLWANGPQRGPAVRFWGILACSLLAAWVLGRLTLSPLRPLEWMLLALGLTQVNLFVSLAIISWFFFLVWRGRESFQKLPAWAYNILQIVLLLLTAGALGVFVSVVSAGLLGDPEMFIQGNGSSRTLLQWYKARVEGALPQPGCLSVSIWWYRFLMLAWALWLASSLLRWLKWGWDQFSSGNFFRSMWKKRIITPPSVGKK